VIVGIIRRRPVLTHPSIVFGGMLALVNSVKKVSNFLTEIWDGICWHQKSWHFLSHFQSENGNNGYRCSEREVFPKFYLNCYHQENDLQPFRSPERIGQ